MNYGEILSKAWKIIWKHKVLWIFGILAGCGSSNSGGSGSSRTNMNTNSGGNMPYQYQQYFDKFTRSFESISTGTWIAIAIGVLLIILICAFLATLGRVGLIRGVNKVEDGAEKLTFGVLLSECWQYFGRVFVLYLLIGLAGLVIGLIIAVPMILLATSMNGTGMALMMPFLCVILCVLLPVGLFVSVWEEQSAIAIVTENLGVFPGLRRGWEVITRNLGQYIVMLVILAILGFVASLIVALPVIVAVLPGIISFSAGSEKFFSTGMILSLILFCLYLPFLLVFDGIIQSYVISAWTLTFRSLTGYGKPNAGEQQPIVDVTPAPPQM